MFGFLDEASIKLMPERRRVIETRIVRYDNVSSGKPKKRSISLFAFMAMKGNDFAMNAEKGNALNLTLFLDGLRKVNPKKRIYMICDNATIHHAKITTEYNKVNGIYFVYLPPYSPDLNAIEYGWKDVKNELNSYQTFDEVSTNAERVAFTTISEKKMGYSRSWREKFMPELKEK